LRLVVLSRHCGPPIHVQRHTSGWTSSEGADQTDTNTFWEAAPKSLSHPRRAFKSIRAQNLCRGPESSEGTRLTSSTRRAGKILASTPGHITVKRTLPVGCLSRQRKTISIERSSNSKHSHRGPQRSRSVAVRPS